MALTPQLEGLEGYRVEVVTTYGEKRRFWVGRNIRSAPMQIHLEILTTRSLGGAPAEMQYASVRVIRGPR